MGIRAGLGKRFSRHCWGTTPHNRQTEPDGSLTHVAVGATHVCAIKSDRTVACWDQEVFFDREGEGMADDIHGKGHHTSTIPPSGSHQYIDISAIAPAFRFGSERIVSTE